MKTQLLLGLLLIALGAFSSGSFAVPFGKIKKWSWESYWLVFSIGAYILFPILACLLFAPDFLTVLQVVPHSVLWLVFGLGAIYGIGNLSFGLALRYLGLSLGYALALGLMLAIGTLVPPILDGRLQVMMEKSGGDMLVAGVALACFGIALTGWAGYIKNSSMSKASNQESIQEFSFVKGVLAAVLVGITGSAMSLGFEQALPIAAAAEELGTDPLFSMMPVMLVLLSGTFVTTLIWCLFLGLKNDSLSDFSKKDASVSLELNYSFSLLGGLLWFGQFIVYGMGKSKMGPYTFTSWGILMALTIVIATLWGIYRKEWKNAPTKIYVLMIFSLLLIIASSFVIGMSGMQ